MADAAVGWIATLIASVLFGSYFVPIKKFDAADGLFFQWVQCAAVFIVGLIINMVQQSPKFYPLAMVGGALWTTGNVTAIPLLRIVGMGLGMLLWGSSQMLCGWAMGKFGWFGLRPQFIRNEIFNYLGVVMALISAILFLFVKVSIGEPSANRVKEDTEAVYYTNGRTSIGNEQDQKTVSKNKVHPISDVPSKNDDTDEKTGQFLPCLPPLAKRIVGILVCFIAGLFYATTFVPVAFMRENRNDSINYPQYFGAPENPMDYLFAYFTGIFVCATFYFVIYCVVMRNRPIMNPQIVLPTLVSGSMWAIAQAAFFVANDHLSEAVTFPVLTRLPPLVAVAWGAIYFKEITGKKNLIILGVAITVTCIAAVFSGISNIDL